MNTPTPPQPPQGAPVQNETDELAARREKIARLQTRGIEPFGRRFERGGTIQAGLDAFTEGAPAALAGRIVALRSQGKAAFGDIQDTSGRIQVYFHTKEMGPEAFELVREINVGDWIGVRGEFFRTRTGQQTVLVRALTVLSKALRPLPEKWHGLKDVETIYRQRYLDLITNEDSRRRFSQRSLIIGALRRYLAAQGTVEVETPMLQPICGGATAKPFKTHYDALGSPFYLRIAPELYLKMLLVGGFERVFELNRSFRNEGLSRRHNPEFTMLEVYWAFEDYRTMMTLTENLVTACLDALGLPRTVKAGETEISLETPWTRLTFHDALAHHVLGAQPETMPRAQVAARILEVARAAGSGIEIAPGMSEDEILVAVFEERVEARLKGPVFVTDYPASVCPLSKTRPDDPQIAERFELYVNGMELANAYSELNDPFLQRQRFEDQVRRHPSEEARVDEDYLLALEHGMPPAGGLGVGIDRLVMLLTGAESIRDVILFPQMKNRDRA